MTFRVKDIIDETFQDYKKPSMFISTCFCDWKCCKENNLDITVCQNSNIAKQKTIEVSVDEILRRYQANPITSSIVIGGLEPFRQYAELYWFIYAMRSIYEISDDIVIYTGYYPNEIEWDIEQLKTFKNIIIKFGRYIPNDTPHIDEVLGIELASSNQYAVKIS
jgi:organic radical activating enzyme